MGAVILVPRRADHGERDAIWEWVRRWWDVWTGLPVIEGWDEGEAPFNRSRALNRAAGAAGGWLVAVVIDADVIVAPGLVERAITRACATGAPVQAYTDRFHLGPVGTTMILGREPLSVNLRFPPHHWVGPDHLRVHDSCSGALVVTRTLWDKVGGFDERFVGWGFEDQGARLAFETLSGHTLVRTIGALYHLHHTVDPGHYPASPTVSANRARAERYLAARGDPGRMREVLASELDPV
jgi:hypothetical protein